MTIRWRGPLLALSLVSVLAIAGCGGDDNDSSSTATVASTQAAVDDGGGSDDAGGGSSDDEFCSKLEDIGKNLQGRSDASDPQQLGQFAEQVVDALQAADPPQELQKEWSTLTGLFSALADVMKNVDLSDPSSLSGIQDELQKFQDKAAELSSATAALSRYATDHCGGAFG